MSSRAWTKIRERAAFLYPLPILLRSIMAHNLLVSLKGLIDWITWAPVTDRSDVGGAPPKRSAGS
jgi:hypothetical protein